VRFVRDRASVRAFLDRPWDDLARLKADYWRAWKARHGALGALRMAEELRQEMLALRPDWPSPAERLEDLKTHLRVSEALRRVPARRR
jgi:hypothetical protein